MLSFCDLFVNVNNMELENVLPVCGYSYSVSDRNFCVHGCVMKNIPIIKTAADYCRMPQKTGRFLDDLGHIFLKRLIGHLYYSSMISDDLNSYSFRPKFWIHFITGFCSSSYFIEKNLIYFSLYFDESIQEQR